MLVFQIGSERLHRDEVFDKPIFLDWYRQQPEEVGQLLREARQNPLLLPEFQN